MGSKRGDARRSCLFCGGTPVSTEHIWPKWFRDALPSLSIHAGRMSGEKYTSRWRTNRVDHTVKRFCEDCNTTWMSEIVGDSSVLLKTMIQKHRTISLTPADQRVLARFAYLVVLTSEFATRDENTTPIPTEAYAAFYQTKDPPSDIVIRTAAYMGDHYLANVRRLELTSKEGAPPYKFYLTTYVMGGAVFQTLGPISKVDFLPARKGPNYFLARIWPVLTETLPWPPNTMALDDSALSHFCNGFGFD